MRALLTSKELLVPSLRATPTSTRAEPTPADQQGIAGPFVEGEKVVLGETEIGALTSKELLVPSLRGERNGNPPKPSQLTSKELLVPSLRGHLRRPRWQERLHLTSKELLVPSLRANGGAQGNLEEPR